MTVFDIMTITPAIFALICAAVMMCGVVGTIVLKCYDKSGHLTPYKSIGYVPSPTPPQFAFKGPYEAHRASLCKKYPFEYPQKTNAFNGPLCALYGYLPQERNY